jgi:type I restriction enzyme S subunit
VIKNFPCIKLKDYAIKIGSGITPSGGESSYKKSGIPLIRSQNVLMNRLDLSNVVFIDEAQHEKMSGSKVKSGDVLINITGASIGRSCIVADIQEANVNQHVCIIRLKEGLDGRLLSFFLNSNFGQKQIWSFQGGGSREGLNYPQIGSFEIPLPPLPEQKAIADLLSTWDEAIEKTEHLIRAKEKYFRWLLRELISELMGDLNNSKWEKVILADVCKIITSNVDKKVCSDEFPVRLCNYMDVYRNNYITSQIDFMWGSATQSEIEKFCLKKNDVLLTKDSETPDDIANSACVIEEFENLLCGYHLAILRPKKQLFGPYLNYVLKTPRVRYEFSRQANGATRFGLGLSSYENVYIPLVSLEEQKQIAETLNTAQQEINILKKLAEKYKTQKRGLMQKLLTGEWRVKPEVVGKFSGNNDESIN